MNYKIYYPKRLTYDDLKQLLKNDPIIKTLIRNTLNQDVESEDVFRPASETSIANTPSAIDPLRQQLSTELGLLTLLANDNALRGHWLGEAPATEGEQLCQLLAVAAQWDRVLQLWEFIADRCKQAQRAATPDEQQLLTASLSIHNLIWRDKAACLMSAEADTPFDYHQHERGNIKGNAVIEQWLPGLKNPAGQLQKKPLVKTH